METIKVLVSKLTSPKIFQPMRFFYWISSALFYTCFMLVTSSCLITREVRHIVPPQLDQKYISGRITGYRPMRRGQPKLSVERKGNQIIATHVGHGGSGWTICFGTAMHVNALLVKEMIQGGLKKSTPITVVGGGISGLSTAYDLVKRGYTHITIIAECFDRTTSHIAGGLVAPVSMDNTLEGQKLVDRLALEAYQYYAEISRGEHLNFSPDCVSILPAYFQSRSLSGLEPYVKAGVMAPAKDVRISFNAGKTMRDMVCYEDALLVKPFIMMQDLTNYLKSNGVQFVQKKITSLNCLHDPVIVNCTGLGSQSLTNDRQLVSVQGHLFHLKNQPLKDLQYMILFYLEKNEKTTHGQTRKDSVYFFPTPSGGRRNHIGILGGTFIEHATPSTPNTEEYQRLIVRARQFFGTS